MKNIQIIEGADNATFSIFQAMEEEFALIFPGAGQDLEVVEDFLARVGEDIAGLTLFLPLETSYSKRRRSGHSRNAVL